MDSGDVWRGKTDEQVLEAHARLPDYTDEGQQVLRMEVERRHLDVSAVPAAPDVSVASAEPTLRPANPSLDYGPAGTRFR